MAEKKEKTFVSLMDLAKKINKEYGNNNLIRRSDIIPQYRRLASGALGMDYVLFGGLPYGRICVYSGKAHSGKTTGACAELAGYQKENPDKMCLYVDVEHALDLQFECMMNKINQEKLLVFSPMEGMSGEQILEEILRIERESDDIGLIVLDSIPALVTAQNLKNDFTKDTGKQGTIAKSMHKFLTEFIPILEAKQNILLLINQVRIKDLMYNGAPIYSEPGGDAPKFYSSVSVRFGTRTFMQGEKELSGSSAGDNADGFRLKFQITKNKTAPTNRGGGFITYRYDTGMDKVKDMFDIATTFDYVQRLNNSTYQMIDLNTGEVLQDENGTDLRGYRKNLINYIETHEEFRNKYFNMLLNYIASQNTLKTSLISEEAEAEIKAEEATVITEEAGVSAPTEAKAKE